MSSHNREVNCPSVNSLPHILVSWYLNLRGRMFILLRPNIFWVHFISSLHIFLAKNCNRVHKLKRRSLRQQGRLVSIRIWDWWRRIWLNFRRFVRREGVSLGCSVWICNLSWYVVMRRLRVYILNRSMCWICLILSCFMWS